MHPGSAASVHGGSSLFVENFEEARTIVDFRGIPVFLDFRVEGLAIVLPFRGGADDLRAFILRSDVLQSKSGRGGLGSEIGGWMLLEFFFGIEAAREDVGGHDHR